MTASQSPAIAQDFGPQFLDGLDQRELKSVLGPAKKLKFPPKATIYVQGDPATHMYLMSVGTARFFYTTPEGRKILGPRILAGETFGGAVFSLRPAPTYLASVETVKECSVLAWERSTIRALAVRHPRLLENMLSIAYDLLEWACAAQVGLASHSARLRLVQALVDLARDVGHRRVDGVEFEATNEELANAANVTVFTTSRLMSEWHRRGAIVKSRGKVRLRSPERLLLDRPDVR